MNIKVVTHVVNYEKTRTIMHESFHMNRLIREADQF